MSILRGAGARRQDGRGTSKLVGIDVERPGDPVRLVVVVAYLFSLRHFFEYLQSVEGIA